MKKIIAFLLATVMLFSFAACGGSVKVDAPVDILTATWNNYAEDQKFFCIGGDPLTQADGAPGAYDVAANAEAAASQLVCLEESAKMVDGAALLMHAMNSNNFTGAAYHIASGYKAEEFITSMENDISNNQWICGFPEKLLIATVGSDYVVIAFGAGDLIETFKTNFVKAFPDAKISVEKAL